MGEEKVEKYVKFIPYDIVAQIGIGQNKVWGEEYFAGKVVAVQVMYEEDECNISMPQMKIDHLQKV